MIKKINKNPICKCSCKYITISFADK